MIELNDRSIAVGQIKQILHSFNLPMFRIHHDGDEYANGEHYLKDGAIFNHDGSEFKPYRFGERIINMTSNLPISSNLYDSKTHEYMGDYLRFLRDFVGMDLMGMYNCCAYDSPRDFDAIAHVGGGFSDSNFSSMDQNYTLMMIPVRWGMKYTIAIDCHAILEMACMHFDDNTMLDYDSMSKYTMIQGTYKKVRGARFNHPFIYDNLSDDSINKRKHGGDALEGTLKLFIKVPESCKSSIVVLEGDFRDCSNDNAYMEGFVQKVGKSPLLKGVDPTTGEKADYSIMMEPSYATKSQLLSLNLGQKALLSDRILEYLSHMAIAPDSDVVDNIKRVQITLRGCDAVGDYKVREYGVWDDSMREAICKYAWVTGIIDKYDDMLSYFDKDVESKIGGLASKHAEPTAKAKTFSDETSGGR